MGFKFYRQILDNGMTIFLERRKDVPSVSVAFAVRNGGINETLSEKGISHFIEHMLYKGTPTRNSKQIAEEIEKKGGELNGLTEETHTAYWCKMPSQHLGVALEVLEDMVKNPLFNREEMNKERKVIFDEIKMRKDNPDIYLWDKISDYLYSGTLGSGLLGTYDIMNSLDRTKLLKKFQQVYTPNNLILGAVGDADFKEILNFAKSNFGNSRGDAQKIEFSKINKSGIEKRKGIEQANLIFAYHVPLSTDKKSYAAEVLNTLMAGGMSSRLFMEVRENRNLAYSVKGDSNINKFFAYNAIHIGTDKENLSLVEKLILEEFGKVSKELSEEELNRVKEQVIGNYHLNMEDSQTQLVNLILEEVDGDASNFYNFEKKVQEVKLEEVRDLAKIDKYSLFSLVPD